VPRRVPLLQGVKERDAVRDEEKGDDNGEPRQVPLDDVRTALRSGSEAHPSEARIPPRVHEDQPAQGHRDEYLEDGEHLNHRAARVSAVDDFEDRLDQLGCDPVLRDVAGRTRVACAINVDTRVGARQHQHPCVR
jgi:hypothetical protein